MSPDPIALSMSADGICLRQCGVPNNGSGLGKATKPKLSSCSRGPFRQHPVSDYSQPYNHIMDNYTLITYILLHGMQRGSL